MTRSDSEGKYGDKKDKNDRPTPSWKNLWRTSKQSFFVGPYGEQDCHNMEYDIDWHSIILKL